MGLASFYNTWARPALFSSVIVSEIDDSALRRTVANVGGQIDFRFVALSHLKFTISLGYAGAFEDHRKFSDEFMFSLKIH
jgi:hypothetical protein